LEARRQHELRADVVVIGGGVVGAAAALAASRSGLEVALLEAGTLAAAAGSSKGAARMVCPAAYPDESYLEAGLRAAERWSEIEAATGERLIRRTGCLSRGAFAEVQLGELRAAGVEAESLSTAEVASRFGVSIPGERPLLFQPDAGVIRADRARGALLRLAAAAGTELRERERVRSLREGADRVELETEHGRWACRCAIVAAGPWTGELLGAAELPVPLTPSLQSVAYLALAEPETPPVGLIDYDGEEPFACWDPEGGLKAAFHARGPAFDPNEASPEPDRAAIERVTGWVRERYGDAVEATPHRAETCVYTNAPGERFILERRDRVVIGSACNGQGFQFAPDTGERLAALAAEAVTEGAGATR
jgi:sarcosine oxidase